MVITREFYASTTAEIEAVSLDEIELCLIEVFVQAAHEAGAEADIRSIELVGQSEIPYGITEYLYHVQVDLITPAR